MAEFAWSKFGQPVTDIPQRGEATEGAKELSPDEKMELISRNLQEVCKGQLMKDILIKEKRDIKIYWGTATTGRPHIAYFVPMSKIADFLRAGCEVTILFADIHGYLDNMKAPWDLLMLRVEYYKEIIKGILESIGVPLNKLRFVTGSDYQLKPEYTLDVLKLASMCSQHDAQKAGAEVVKQTQSPPLSGLMYPLLQWLDEEYLGVDAQFGGVDQRKIFMSAEKYLPKIGYKARAHLMNPMVPGLTGEKMSASVLDSKIDVLDTPAKIKKKINKVFCEPGNVEVNPLLAFIKSVIMLIYGKFQLDQRDQESLVFTDAEELIALFKAEKIHPGDLKASVIRDIVKLLEPIRKKFEDPKLQKLSDEAYPEFAKASGRGPKKEKTDTKQDKKDKKEKKKAEKKPEAPANTAKDISRVNLQIGKIVSIKKHPDAEALFVEQIDLGEETGPRTVISGLVNKVPIEELENRMVVVVSNLKPANMRGIKSHAMLLCASTADKVEPIDPPEGVAIGERITVEGYSGDADSPHLPPKKKIWEAVSPDLAVNDDLVATWKGVPLMTSKGPLRAKTLKGAPIK